ncbi:MAG: tetratricopeptide repeat protein [Bacteroidetes bacterium]|jgi:tetratricopeptide (TPR) repeat protein|nr:tetratricopeptide repeat protein [Bacteroidota bacterium]
MPDRITTLRQFLLDSPEDPFVHYALAQEYAKLGDTEQAERYYQHLVDRHPGYVATYYHYGKLCVQQNRRPEAAQLFEQGIQKARAAGDAHSARELLEALNTLHGEAEDEDED